ncbi:uncharacterized protein LOC34619809 [Cyclospora cayetanensis]|uniref:Uncharacterized protein LOC34619809 n=1 Tax=Cyclospora cayetanensis TaxID=88456 RepID=A0A6P6RRS7_9EIME|nr:uncharacterized protein LOC34619809 [Cyclospora cayetanensis]
MCRSLGGALRARRMQLLNGLHNRSFKERLPAPLASLQETRTHSRECVARPRFRFQKGSEACVNVAFRGYVHISTLGEQSKGDTPSGTESASRDTSGTSSIGANPRFSLFSSDVLALPSSQAVLHFANHINPAYLFNKHDLLLFLQQLAVLQHVRSSGRSFCIFWKRAAAALLLHKDDGRLLRLAFLKLAEAKCSSACFDLLPLVQLHSKSYSALELADLFWQLSVLSLPLDRAAATHAAVAAVATPPGAADAAASDRVLLFREALLQPLTRKRKILESSLTQHQQRLIVYRLIYGAAKQGLKIRDAPELFPPIIDQACDLLEPRATRGDGSHDVFSASQTVRIVWGCAALQSSNRKLFEKARSRILECVDDFSYEELQILLQVFQAIGLADNILLGALQSALKQISSLTRGVSTVSTARRKGFKRKEKRVSMTDHLPSYPLSPKP